MNKRLLIFGFGYTAAVLSKLLIKKGWQVFGITRSELKFRNLEKESIEPILWEDSEKIEVEILNGTSILISTPPDKLGDPTFNKFSGSISLEPRKIEWVGYLSTTGVYGDYSGQWVDESSKLRTTTKRGKRRVRAENIWQSFSREINLPLHIFRLSGIYGPNRNPFKNIRGRTAKRILKPDQVFNRIHVDDIAGVLYHSMVSPDPGMIYNLSDDMPCPGGDVVEEAAKLLGLPIPLEVNFKDANLSEMANEFYSESKRVSNKRLKEKLNYKLKYPNYRLGLKSLLDFEDID